MHSGRAQKSAGHVHAGIDPVKAAPEASPRTYSSLDKKAKMAAPIPAPDLAQALGSGLDSMANDIARNGRVSGTVTNIGRIGAALAAGWVIYLFRGGSLLAGFLSSVPLWRGFDPLPILEFGKARSSKKKRKSEERLPASDKRDLNSYID